jgi:GR25 family glycosyltransferase involved in LPS biosynthesis
MPCPNGRIYIILPLLLLVLLADVARSSVEDQRTKHKKNNNPSSVHIINLDRDTVRWESVTTSGFGNSLDKHQIRRLVAIYGKDLSDEELRQNTTWVARHFVTRGIIGCYLSHRKFWECTLLSSSSGGSGSGEDYQICFEDDVVVLVKDDDKNFLRRVSELVDELEECDADWDVLFLGALGCVHPDGKFGLNRIAGFMSGGGRKRRRITPHIHVPHRPLGAHAYALSKRGAAKLLQGASKVTGHVDVVAWGLPNLKVYCVHPMLVYQGMEAQSTIGAVTKGLETKLPRIVVDDYTGIRFEWVFNAPVLQLGPILLTMGRSVIYILGGYIVAWLLRDRIPWLLPLHSGIFAILFVLQKTTTIRRGMPAYN